MGPECEGERYRGAISLAETEGEKEHRRHEYPHYRPRYLFFLGGGNEAARGYSSLGATEPTSWIFTHVDGE